ncbi:uncharacterized protein CIMG_01778 [Coccidioides immitis RS]|uniref:Uncharacterized protein n=2 Tax=Coccidioides immitis TaxID=5501 RepID=J3KJX1_COCIM|nr:uncharacterized protein CIMG_01778 [Coccidioides immitis RS]EAS36424.3 hypothetical protein CIMG_01778 [Coccidioides immitis RS]KMU76236.1 hypothetical protein CISG_00971 [Coccidioides immitis RMSCC 3703]
MCSAHCRHQSFHKYFDHVNDIHNPTRSKETNLAAIFDRQPLRVTTRCSTRLLSCCTGFPSLVKEHETRPKFTYHQYGVQISPIMTTVAIENRRILSFPLCHDHHHLGAVS